MLQLCSKAVGVAAMRGEARKVWLEQNECVDEESAVDAGCSDTAARS